MRRYFIVGAPRSGTTLLQSLLGCSPELANFPESHFFSRGFTNRLGPPILIRPPDRLVRAFCADMGIDEINGLAFGIRAVSLSLFDARVAGRYFIQVLDRLARAASRRAWLEKTPYHLHRIAIIERTLADEPPEFIHIVRDGVDVAASHARASLQWKRPVTPRQAAALWQEDIKITLRHAALSNHHVVFYEDLASNPVQVATRLARRLSLALTAADLERRSQIVQQIVAPSESWKGATMCNDIAPLSPHEYYLSDEERRQIELSIDRRAYIALRTVAV